MIRVVVALLFAALGADGSAAEVPGDARQWWLSLDKDSRYEIQGNLILTGHYRALVDGDYGQLTYEAMTAYEVSLGLLANGILSGSELAELGRQADKVYADLGMAVVSDTSAGVSTYAPLAILTQEVRELEGGLTLSSPDGEFVLALQGWDHDGTSLEGARDYLLRAMPDAEITYQTARADRAVVSGRTGSDSFYAMVHADRDKVVGFSVVWTENYASSAFLTAMFAASYSGRSDWFEQGASTAGEQVAVERSAAGGERIGAFFLPGDDDGIIILAGDINQGAALDFIRARRKHGEATTLILSSDGGSVEEGLLVAQQVFDRGLSTYIPKGAGCYSACAFIFFAGKSRVADGELGVHQVSGDGVTAADAQLVLSDVLAALDDFGVPDEVVSSMLRTRPEDMHIFSERELAAVEIEPQVIEEPKVEVKPSENDKADAAELEATTAPGDAAIQPHIKEATFASRQAFADALWSLGVSQGNAFNVGSAFDPLPPVLPAGAFVKVRFGAKQSQEWLPQVVWISVPASSGEMRLAAVITRGADGIYGLDYLVPELLGT